MIRIASLLAAFFTSFFTAFSATALAGVVVVDAEYGTPVDAVAVSAADGTALGLTGPDGSLPPLPAGTGTVTLRHIAFEPLTIAAGAADTVRLTPRSFAIPEVVVTDRYDYVRVEGYYRSYSSMGNSAMSGSALEEGTVVYYLRPDKKGRAHDKGRRYGATVYERITRRADDKGKSATDSLSVRSGKQGGGMSDLFGDDLELPLLLDTERFAGADASAPLLTLPGKYSPLGTVRNNGQTLVLTFDKLSDHKEHRYSPAILKLFGLTADCLEYTVTQTYDAAAIPRRPADITSLLSIGENWRVKGRGKWFKKIFGGEEIDFRVNTEIFITSMSFLTKEQAREAREADALITPREAPQTVPPLDPAALELRRAALAAAGARK